MNWVSNEQRNKLSLFYKSFVYLWDLNAKSKRRFGWSWCFPSSAGFALAGRAQHVLETDARLWYARSIGGVATCQRLGVFLCEYHLAKFASQISIHSLFAEVNFFGNLRKPFCLFAQNYGPQRLSVSANGRYRSSIGTHQGTWSDIQDALINYGHPTIWLSPAERLYHTLSNEDHSLGVWLELSKFHNLEDSSKMMSELHCHTWLYYNIIIIYYIYTYIYV